MDQTLKNIIPQSVTLEPKNHIDTSKDLSIKAI